jgi:hypothetical protein
MRLCPREARGNPSAIKAWVYCIGDQMNRNKSYGQDILMISIESPAPIHPVPYRGARAAPQRCPILRAGADIVPYTSRMEPSRRFEIERMQTVIEELVLHGIRIIRCGTGGVSGEPVC